MITYIIKVFELVWNQIVAKYAAWPIWTPFNLFNNSNPSQAISWLLTASDLEGVYMFDPQWEKFKQTTTKECLRRRLFLSKPHMGYWGELRSQYDWNGSASKELTLLLAELIFCKRCKHACALDEVSVEMDLRVWIHCASNQGGNRTKAGICAQRWVWQDKYKEKMEKTMTQTIYVMTHERAKTGDCGQQRSSVSPESGPGFEFSAGAGSGSRILDPDWVSDFGNHWKRTPDVPI